MLRAILATWVLAAAVCAGQTVEGHVINSVTGAGVPGATVRLEQDGKNSYTGSADSQGRFYFEAVKAGVYTASYEASGFWSVPSLIYFGGQPFAVTAGGSAVRLELKLPPIGKVSGRVLDAAGSPVPNARLWLRWGSSWCKLPNCRGFLHQAKTGDKGEYSLTDLEAPGTWLVSATAPPDWPQPESPGTGRLGWAHTFYPGVTSAILAAEVLVRPASDLSNLDIKLASAPLRRIRGVVVDMRGEPVSKASVMLGKNYGPSLSKETGSDGAFEFEVASAVDDEWHLSATLKRDGVTLWTGREVRIQDEDLENLELRLTAPFAIRGKVVIEIPEGAPPKMPQIMAFYAGAAVLADTRLGAPIFPGIPDAKGDFTIRNVFPGPYMILAQAPPPRYYLDSIRLGDLDALRSDIPILSDAQPLVVTFKLGGGTVRGTIEACRGGDVFLVSQDPALRRGSALLRAVPCARNGHFEFLGVRPGEYYGYAIAGDSLTAWREFGLGEIPLNQATRVTVRANESTSAEIRLIQR